MWLSSIQLLLAFLLRPAFPNEAPLQGNNTFFIYVGKDNDTVGNRSSELRQDGSLEAFRSHVPGKDGRLPCTCGIPDLSDRIVGGKVVSPSHRYPWVVAIVNASAPKMTFCGGSLVSPRHVITAYHCFIGLRGRDRDLRVRIGVFDLQEPLTGPGLFIRRIRTRLQPSQRQGRQDLTVLVLDWPVPCGPTVRPICLPRRGTDFAGRFGQVAGWGRTAYDGNTSRCLQSVDVKMVSTKECQDVFSQIFLPVTDMQICAGTLDGSKDACEGDSGGPMMYLDRSRNRWKLAGVVSQGTRCATKDFYGLYTNVSYYSKFISWATGNAAKVF